MNACKHSRRASAEVDIDISATSVDICVIDEGVGFDTQAQRSATGRRFGLAQLRERVRTAGGSLAIESAVGEGCRATVRLPSPSRNPRSSPSAGDPAPEPAVN
jgi:signal transduction histidine kinase